MRAIFVFLLIVSALSFAATKNTIKIEGLNELAEKNVKLYLQTLGELNIVSDQRIEKEITDSLKPLGYYRLKAIKLEKVEDLISIDIQPGMRTKLNQVEITLLGTAENDHNFNKIINQSPLKSGHYLNHGDYEALKSKLVSLAIERGYFDAKMIKSTLDIYPDQAKADVCIIFDSGIRYDFGELSIDGSQINPLKVRSLADFKRGKPYLASKLSVFNQRIATTGWFSSVFVGGDVNKKVGNEVPINVVVAPQVKNKMEVGVGYTTNHGPRLKLNWRKPWINSAGHSLDLRSEISQDQPTLSMAYKIPLEDVMHQYYQLQGEIKYVDAHDTVSTNLNVAIERHWALYKWDQYVNFRWVVEDFSQGAFEDGNASFGLLGTGLSRTHLQGGIIPKKGRKTKLFLGYSDRFLGADTSLISLQAKQGWIHSFGYYLRTVIKLEAGATITDQFSNVPPSMRYFLGGDGSIRGYRYQSLSPRDIKHKQLGGQYMLSGSFEWQFRVAQKWWIATFYDIGSSWIDQLHWNRGTGIGLRWASPVGSIRFDVGFGLDDPDNQFQLHFTLGPEL